MGALDEYYQLKPECGGAMHREILSCFYLARRDGPDSLPIPQTVLHESVKLLRYEPDWAAWLLSRLDDHYLKWVAARLERDRQKHTNKN